MQDLQAPRSDNVPSFSQSGLVLPTPSIQNQIHELAKTLPPPRKQNTACDACRSRKVKCHRLPGHDKHCLSKNYPCTSVHYVQQATSEKKRNSAARRPRNISTSTSPSSPGPSRLPSPTGEGGIGPWFPSLSHSPLAPRPTIYPSVSPHTSTTHLLSYLFSPPDIQSIIPPFNAVKSRLSPYADWGEMASKLEEEAFRAEFALDLVEVYFQIVHTRLPLLNPIQFRARLNLAGQTAFDEPLHPALVATVLAWGAKFSEHPLLIVDRQRNNGQSRMAKALIERTRELAESMKVHRVPSADNVVISLLIEPLQSQDPHSNPNNGFHGFWLTSGIRNLLGLQINHKSVMSDIKDPEARGTMIFAWWMACIADAYSSFYYRRKPMLDDDDYDIDFYTADPLAQETTDMNAPSPREQLEFLGYYRAAHALARISRQIARQLWRPTTDSDGIPLEAALSYASELTKWRDAHLPKVGVPSNFEAEWDFVSAVSACASDASYHVMWILLFNALDEFGIRNNSLAPSGINQVETLKRKIFDEALHSALRIAALVGVLTSNGYLRLDPAVMHVSCINAGMFLARLGRPEVQTCIAGLEQYTYAYEEAGEQATEIKRVYANSKISGPDFHDMSSVASRLPSADAMSVDSAINGHGNGSDHGIVPNAFAV
ncbi:hypothetical protein SERLADRAFT_450284 [Serpula lacrymans var. lacrymans S7.9]|uniref:Zn(2)-C6 fungal-type domain-containing protein n=1 Tax=Serpula lacrymans var. lacrymans (strain S7.9) TaxID=578457 RepID=F8NZG8_SERL9|nr:uncharacterized protein SERLADRAFT_450284 [Serpula lacrymans var. lacrymans S7.9]EGO23988.1 hypothetical protein SERLADRAFT_450284 [Serpula lacrymans var. lacrymans S7.9]